MGGIVMDRFVLSRPQEIVIWTAVLAVVIAVVVYLIGLIRAKAIQQEPDTSDLISKFRESHSQGELTDEEFRTIKTVLATQLQDELKDDGETG